MPENKVTAYEGEVPQQMVGKYINKTKKNNKKFCQKVITQSKNRIISATTPCLPLCAVFPRAAGKDTPHGCEDMFEPLWAMVAKLEEKEHFPCGFRIAGLAESDSMRQGYKDSVFIEKYENQGCDIFPP